MGLMDSFVEILNVVKTDTDAPKETNDDTIIPIP